MKETVIHPAGANDLRKVLGLESKIGTDEEPIAISKNIVSNCFQRHHITRVGLTQGQEIMVLRSHEPPPIPGHTESLVILYVCANITCKP